MKKNLLITVALLGMVAQGAWALNTPFVQCSWNGTTNSVDKTTITDKPAIVLPNSDGQWVNLGEAGTVSYYEITDSVTPKVIQIIGEVHLILDNNSTLTVEHIRLEAGNTLHIHRQAADDGTVGKITVSNTSYNDAAGIGSAQGTSCGTLYVHGGDITTTGAEDGAGIGGGEDASGGTIVIYDGTVTATGQGNAAGIGGGYAGNGGTITIYGGTVTAQGGKNAAGIGGGEKFNGGGNGGTITIWGGTITATGGMSAAGIGRGKDGDGGEVTLNGGEIYANGGNAGFTGIGLGSTITFGNVRVYRGLGADSYAALHTSSPQRADVCVRNRYVKIVGCTEHQFICSTCTYCGLHSETPQTSKYIDRTWDGSKVVETERDIVDAINLAEQLTIIPARDGSSSTCDKGGDITGKTYYVSGELDLTDYTLYDNGQVSNIILCDDAELRVHHILVSGDGGKLHFYGQKKDSGKLIANEAKTHNGRMEYGSFLDKKYGCVAIGGNEAANYIDLYFHGGDITGYGSDEGGNPAIGMQDSDDHSFTHIYGGRIEGFGIRGEGFGQGNNISIYGGTAIGHGGPNSPGIGGQYFRRNFDEYKTTAVTIWGGTVEAYGGEEAAGIGGRKNQMKVFVDIRGGQVTAVGGDYAAGIGCARSAILGGINITGGTVTATGGKYAAGIGAGINSHSGTITITGGTVYAYGGVDAAGIGGGEGGNAGSITISGGIVYAESTGENSNSAGIGAGEDGYCNSVKITGGTVFAKGGSGSGPAIGSNLSDKLGPLSLPDNYMVEAGSNENSIERRFTGAERIDACHWRRYAEITECTHSTPLRGSDKTEAVSYTISGDNTHTIYCRYCNLVESEEHTFVENVCNKCGKTFNADEDTWTVTIHQTSTGELQAQGHYDTSTQYQVLKGQVFNLPEIPEIEGVSMLALVKVTGTQDAPETVWLTDDEMANRTNFFDPSQPFTPTQDTHFYPRYRFDYTANWTWGTANGKVDVSNVQLSLTNPLLDYENIIYLQSSDITTEEDKDKDDVKYTATVQYQPMAGVTYSFTDVKHDRYYDDIVEMYDNKDNRNTVSKYDGKTVEMRINGRTLYHDGSWNTICLPFALTAEQLAAEDCPLHGANIKALTDASFADGTLTLTFSDDLDATEAGKTYLVKWAQGDNVTNPVFKNVTITDEGALPVIIAKDKNGNATTEYENLFFGIVFWGSYNPTVITDDIVASKELLYLGAGNKLYYPNAQMTIGAFRGYFQLYGITAGDLPQGVRSIVLNFLDDDDPAGITAPRSSVEQNGREAWYSLDGRHLNGKPTAKGLYINNGKKIVIK